MKIIQISVVQGNGDYKPFVVALGEDGQVYTMTLIGTPKWIKEPEL